jgi:hypothetical protein
METEFSQQIFENSSGIKINENPPIGSRIVRCGQSDRWKDAQTDRWKEAQTDRWKDAQTDRWKDAQTDRWKDAQTDRWKDAQTNMTMEISLFTLLRDLKEYAGFFRSVTRFAHNDISRKMLEIMHVAEGIEKSMLNRRTHLWRIDNARLPSIVSAGLKQKEMLEETFEKAIP